MLEIRGKLSAQNLIELQALRKLPALKLIRISAAPTQGIPDYSWDFLTEITTLESLSLLTETLTARKLPKLIDTDKLANLPNLTILRLNNKYDNSNSSLNKLKNLTVFDCSGIYGDQDSFTQAVNAGALTKLIEIKTVSDLQLESPLPHLRKVTIPLESNFLQNTARHYPKLTDATLNATLLSSEYVAKMNAINALKYVNNLTIIAYDYKIKSAPQLVSLQAFTELQNLRLYGITSHSGDFSILPPLKELYVYLDSFQETISLKNLQSYEVLFLSGSSLVNLQKAPKSKIKKFFTNGNIKYKGLENINGIKYRRHLFMERLKTPYK